MTETQGTSTVASTVAYGYWTCYNCGAAVPNGVTHRCPTGPHRTDIRWNLTTSPTPALTNEVIDRIARRVLELLAERLGTATE